MTNVIPRDRAYFQARTTVNDQGCWVWQLQSARAGHGRGGLYGRARCPVQRRPVGAHVLAYKNLVGSVPDGHEIDHTCRNTLCCNPDHLEAVTPAENNRRRWASGDGANQNTDKTHCPKCREPYSMESKRGDGRTFRSCRPCTQAYQREYHARKKGTWTDG
jgi:hypothetical protein